MHAACMSVPSLCGLGRAAAAVATLAAALLVLGVHQHHRRGGRDRGGGLDSGGGGGGAAVVTRVKDGANPRTRTVAERMDSLSGCYHVYLDVGSNVGVQVRKLYDPLLFRPAVPAAEHWYSTLFGGPEERDPKEICTVGFEPNKEHTPVLRRHQDWYDRCGWPVRFLTETAAAERAGEAPLFTDEAKGQKEWGASIVKSNKNLVHEKGTVSLVRLSSYILDLVSKRDLGRSPDPLRPPAVLMKMDIEGSELEVVPDLLVTGALRHVNVTMIEWHRHTATPDRVKTLNHLAKGVSTVEEITHAFRLVASDDESYFAKDLSAPECAGAGA